jgi:phosphatidylglycerophosphatase A
VVDGTRFSATCYEGRVASEADPKRSPMWAIVVGTFFGSGLSPKAPGTMGSLASLVIWAPLIVLDVAWCVRLLVAAAIFLVGTIAAEAIVRAEGREDPQKVVVDEVVGMGVTLCLSTHSWLSCVLGFALFRLFDIWKPWPVRWADRKVHGGFGVMLDDVVAGLYALLALWFIEAYALPLVAEKFGWSP